MNKTRLVLRYEILTTVKNKSFLFTAFALPLLAALIFLGVSLLQEDGGSVSGQSTAFSDPSELHVEGYVDQSRLITAVPPDIPEGILVAYPDETSARRALEEKEIDAYYIVPADYVETGDLIYINSDYAFIPSRGQSWLMRQTIFANLLDNDAGRIARAAQPMDVQVTPLSPANQRDDDSPAAFYVPYATMMILYFVLIMSASLLLNSISNEKKNRVIEILLLSVTPRQMLTGKIVGLGILGLLQTAIWLGTGYTMLRLSGRMVSLPAGFEIPPSILIWGIVFFLLGYAVYASLMAGLGALVPNLKEASQAVILVIWPLIIPLFLFAALIEKPNGAVATGLSLFPLTAPVAMVTRLVAGDVPLWQLGVAIGLLLVTAAAVLRAVAAMFHAQTLLSGQPFSAGRFFRALLGPRQGGFG